MDRPGCEGRSARKMLLTEASTSKAFDLDSTEP